MKIPEPDIQNLRPAKLAIRVFVLLLILAVVLGFCASIGSQSISLKNAISAIGDKKAQVDNIDYKILFSIRLPRVLLAALIGAALACCGVALQAILRNPLAEPYILGISSGAGLGATVAILFGPALGLPFGSQVGLLAFIGAFGTVWLVWLIGYAAGGRRDVTSLLLAGVVINAFFSAVIMFLSSIARAHQQRATVMWLMGNLQEKDVVALSINAVLILGGIAALFCLAHKLNVLSFGDAEAKGLGIDAARTRILTFAFASFVTAIAVSLSGLIGFVGLIIPHMMRLIYGPDHRQLIPLSAIAGAGFLVIADTIARTVIAPAQIPVGVITALAGGPFFLILLVKYAKKTAG